MKIGPQCYFLPKTKYRNVFHGPFSPEEKKNYKVNSISLRTLTTKELVYEYIMILFSNDDSSCSLPIR